MAKQKGGRKMVRLGRTNEVEAIDSNRGGDVWSLEALPANVDLISVGFSLPCPA